MFPMLGQVVSQYPCAISRPMCCKKRFPTPSVGALGSFLKGFKTNLGSQRLVKFHHPRVLDDEINTIQYPLPKVFGEPLPPLFFPKMDFKGNKTGQNKGGKTLAVKPRGQNAGNGFQARSNFTSDEVDAVERAKQKNHPKRSDGSDWVFVGGGILPIIFTSSQHGPTFLRTLAVGEKSMAIAECRSRDDVFLCLGSPTSIFYRLVPEPPLF